MNGLHLNVDIYKKWTNNGESCPWNYFNRCR